MQDLHTRGQKPGFSVYIYYKDAQFCSETGFFCLIPTMFIDHVQKPSIAT